MKEELKGLFRKDENSVYLAFDSTYFLGGNQFVCWGTLYIGCDNVKFIEKTFYKLVASEWT